MAGLAGLLGGYGSDEDEEQQQEESGAPLLAGILGAHSGSLSPAAAAAFKHTADAAAEQQAEPSSSDQQQQPSQAPMRILEGPSTNPEPPLEGLSPPMARELDSNMESEAGEGALPSALYALPSELRDPPPGEPDPELQSQLNTFLGWVRTGRSVMDELRKDRRWQNPKFLQKTVKFFDLQQYGTNLRPEVWDPQSIPEEDMWPALQQQLEARKRRRGAEVKFQSAGQQLPPAGPGAAAAAAAAAVANQPGLGAAGGAPKMVSIDPRAAAAQAQALASTLVAGAKKSKWDK